jgi:hypothetical protein
VINCGTWSPVASNVYVQITTGKCEQCLPQIHSYFKKKTVLATGDIFLVLKWLDTFMKLKHTTLFSVLCTHAYVYWCMFIYKMSETMKIFLEYVDTHLGILHNSSCKFPEISKICCIVKCFYCLHSLHSYRSS